MLEKDMSSAARLGVAAGTAAFWAGDSACDIAAIELVVVGFNIFGVAIRGGRVGGLIGSAAAVATDCGCEAGLRGG